MNDNTDRKRIQIIIAAHKEYRMPEDQMYVPLHVGACRNKPHYLGEVSDTADSYIPPATNTGWDAAFEKDDTGKNISYLNPSFCELTGLYWAWKNLDADFLGLAHYRRHFYLHKKGDAFSSILTFEEIEPFLDTVKVFVPKKRKYYIESLYSHYAHTHFAVQLDSAREAIEKYYPKYLPSYDRVIKHTYGYMFNMMIMAKEQFDSYCDWLFDILFAMKDELGAKMLYDESDGEKRDMPELSDFQARFYGRVSEILFNVWLDYQIETGSIQQSQVKELGFINLEGESWGKKIASFLKAKFFGQKYEQSF